MKINLFGWPSVEKTAQSEHEKVVTKANKPPSEPPNIAQRI